MADIDGKNVVRVESWLKPHDIPNILSIVMVTGEVQQRTDGDR